jgi:DNA-directed RNA polymerase subunit K/omega
VIHRPSDVNAFEYIIMAAQRTAQLMRGCLPTIDVATQKVTTIAQSEVAVGKIKRASNGDDRPAAAVVDDPPGRGSTPVG